MFKGFNRFDICAGYYSYAQELNDGLYLPSFNILKRLRGLGYRPGYGCVLSEGGLRIFIDLMSRYHSGEPMPSMGSKRLL